MNNILIDTNVYSCALRGLSDVVNILQRAGEIAICSVSIGELLSGFKGGSKERENREELYEFLDSQRVQICCIDETTAEYYSDILNNLREAGTPIPTNDIWIAAVAFQHGLKLFSKDQHFDNIPGLMRIYTE